MFGVIRTAARTILIAGMGLSGATLLAGPALACQQCQKTINVPVFKGAVSEDNLPSVCDGQVGYWEQIPMPGGKTFCVMHFTEFFKGNVGSGTEVVPCYNGNKRFFLKPRH